MKIGPWRSSTATVKAGEEPDWNRTAIAEDGSDTRYTVARVTRRPKGGYAYLARSYKDNNVNHKKCASLEEGKTRADLFLAQFGYELASEPEPEPEPGVEHHRAIPAALVRELNEEGLLTSAQVADLLGVNSRKPRSFKEALHRFLPNGREVLVFWKEDIDARLAIEGGKKGKK